MLTVTEDAASLIRSLGREVNAPAGSGLRIAIDADHHSLSMSLAPDASPGDAVVQIGEARVFVSLAAADRLASRTLQAKCDAKRSSFFLT